MESSSWEKTRRDYESYLKLEKGLSDNSVSSYLRDIQAFVDYFGGAPETAQAHHIEGFMAALYDRRLSKTSQARMLSGLKSFYQFLLYTGVVEAAPTQFIDPPKIPRTLPDTLSVEEIDAILAAIDLSTPLGHRNRAMVELLYSCGLRASELTGLRLPDLFFDEGFVRVTGKGDKQRLVPMSDEARRQLMPWLEQRRTMIPTTEARELVFLNRRGGGLSRVMLFRIIKELVAVAGIDKSVSPHTLRHSFATHLLAGGANIRQIQQMLGHESILTTEIYTHVERSQLRQSLATHHPLGEQQER